MSIHENKTEESIKVSVENTNPKEWKTLKTGETISTVTYGNYYLKAGLTQVVKEKPKEAPKEKLKEVPKEVAKEKPVSIFGQGKQKNKR